MTKEQMLSEIKMANAEVFKVLQWVKEHEDAFDIMDLKMHDAFFYDESEDMEKDFPLTYEMAEKGNSDQFHWWCEDMWLIFEEWLEEEGIKWNKIRNGVGQTSSFYLHDQSIIEFDRRTDGYDSINILENFLYNEWNYYTLPLKGGFIDEEMDLEDYEEYHAEDVDYIKKDFYKEFTEMFADAVKVYEYIKNCKDNQVELFKEYIQCREDELKYEAEQEEKYEQERQELLGKFENETIREIYERNGLNTTDLRTLLSA